MREARQYSGVFLLLITLFLLGASPARAEEEGYAPPPAESVPVEGQMDPALGSQLIYSQSNEGAATPLVFSTAAAIFKTRVPRLARKVAAAPVPVSGKQPSEVIAADESEAVEQEATPAAANAPVADRGLLSQVETDEAKRATSGRPASRSAGASGRLLQAVKRPFSR